MADAKEELIRALTAIAKSLNARFTLNGKPLSYEEVFADKGLLPGLVKRADQLASLTIGYGLGASYEDDSEAKLGTKVTFDDSTPNSLRLMYITDIIHQLMESAFSRDSISLDELMYD